LDTDIGSDIDDTWALGMLLNSSELDVKLITVVGGNTQYRAKLVAKFLEEAGRTDIPIGIGIKEKNNKRQSERSYPQYRWIKDFKLKNYGGQLINNAMCAMRDVIANLSDANSLPIIIGIGPLGNIAELIKSEPWILKKTRFIGMIGSIYRGYGGVLHADREYNVISDIPACQSVFEAEWNRTITPLDTCGLVQLEGNEFKEISESNKPIPSMIMENYKLWAKSLRRMNLIKSGKSSILFDVVAIYLAYSEANLEIKNIEIDVNGAGDTLAIGESDGNFTARKHLTRVAIKWRDLSKFKQHLVDRLVGNE